MNNIKMKRVAITILLLFVTLMSWACPVCERQQPKLLKGVIHGQGPNSKWDYLIICLFVLITIMALYYSIKWLIKPGEADTNHIKYSILNEG